MSITIERITEIAGCEACHEVASRVWGEEAACSVPQMLVHALYGGVVLLARDNGLPVGFVFSFPALYQGNWVLWSHETAVLPECLHKGIGFELKMEQWRIGAKMPFHAVAWTFDPLISRNAHFNLNKLHAQISEYKVNAYGIMKDLINKSLETDRFIALWPFNREGIPLISTEKNMISGGDPAFEEDKAPQSNLAFAKRQESSIVLNLDENPSQSDFPLPSLHIAGVSGLDELVDVDELGKRQNVETRIPLYMEQVFRENPQVATAWRRAFREAAMSLIEKGYCVQGFERRETYGVYIWQSAGLDNQSYKQGE